jgi:hypothetical protein
MCTVGIVVVLAREEDCLRIRKNEWNWSELMVNAIIKSGRK